MAKKQTVKTALDVKSVENSQEAVSSMDSIECTISIFCDMHGGIHPLDRVAVIRKYRDEKKLFSEWKAILVKATVIKAVNISEK
tara:strand:- start:85410 stop:85661 length:252 start_codon:yes stop_codon:yes gene_type:complete